MQKLEKSLRNCFGLSYTLNAKLTLEGEEEKAEDVIKEIIKNKTGEMPRVSVEHLHEPEIALI